MSLSEILSSALSGLGAAQSGIRTVSTNIANVNTPGYARQKIAQTTDVIEGRVVGVSVGEPTRVADKFLEGAVYVRAGAAGRAEAESTYLGRLQSLLGAPGAEAGLPARLDAIAKSATAMTGAAGSTQTNAVFVANVTDAIASIRSVASDVEGLRADVEGEVGSTVGRVNTLLRTIHDLNETISKATGAGLSVSGSADQRTTAIEELSGLMGVVAREQPDGRVTIDTTAGVQLVDRRLRQLSYPASGAGSAQPTYPPIEVRLVGDDGAAGVATGETVDSGGAGGKLGGLIDLRDRQLPAFSVQLNTLFSGLAQTLNAASNAATSVSPPATLTGRASALTGADRLGFTGAATFAVTRSDGTLLAKTRVDFSALGAGASVDDAVAAINAGLGSAATASFANGRLTIAASAAGTGVVVAQDVAAPSARAGVGFSQYFELNDMVGSDTAMLAPTGFAASDAHGFAAGQSTEFALRDASGRMVARYALSGATGTTFGDLVTALNASPIARYGSFAMTDSGRVAFTPSSADAGATLSVLSDSTDRAGTGRGFAEIAGLRSDARALETAEVRRDIVADPGRLPLATLQDVAVGRKALGANDRSTATGYVDAFSSTIDLGSGGVTTVARFAAATLAAAGTNAARAATTATETSARRDDAIARRDNYSGVSIDEELSQMVVLQNSYSAAARVMTTATEMYDTLLGMVR